MRPFLIFVLASLWLSQPAHAAGPLIELVPFNASKAHLVLIFPGGKLAPEQYQALADAIDRASQGRVAVLAARFSANLPNPLQADARITAASEMLRSNGISHPESRIYLAGHSDGGIMGHGPAAKHRLAGLILLGSYLPNAVVFGASLAEYPLPVLMMIGDRDGHTGVNFLARELLRLPASIEAWRKPVLLIPGANHLQMADGSSVAEDLPPLTPIEEVHARVAHNIVDFIDAHDKSENLRSLPARERLSDRQLETRTLLKPFEKTWTRHETLCANSVTFADSTTHTRPLIFKQRIDFPTFLAANPVSEQGKNFDGKIPTYIEPTLDPFDISLNRYIAPPAVACKYPATAKVSENFDLTEADDSCAALNIKALTEALAAMNNSDLGGSYQPFRLGFSERIESNSSEPSDKRSWTIGPITLISRRADSLLQWIGSPVTWRRNDTDRWQLEVSHWTSNDGTSHCKLIAPLKIVEWATTLLPKELHANDQASISNLR